MLVKEATKQTWAYINQQLDFAPSRRIKVHLTINENHSLCGISLAGGEYGEGFLHDDSIFDAWDNCKRCRRVLKKLRGGHQ